MMLNINVGSTDRVLRVLLGIGLIALVFVGPKTPLGWIGVVPLITGLSSRCPLYSIFGWNSCGKK